MSERGQINQKALRALLGLITAHDTQRMISYSF